MVLPQLSYWDSIGAIVAAALVVHLIFKRTETHEPAYVLLLLLVVPSALTLLFLQHTSSIFYAAFTVFGVYWTSVSSSILLYRVSPWHPLAKYPGPLLCKLSKFYLAFKVARGGKQHIYYKSLHEKYGDIVRVGPNELIICDVNAVNPILGPTGLPKGPFWEGRVPEQEAVKPLIAIRDKQEHNRRRRPWTRAFSTPALKGYEIMVSKRSFQLMDALGAQKGIVNLTQWVSFFAYDIMNDLAFGGGSEMIKEGDADGLWHLLEAGQRNALFMSHVPWLGALFLRFPSFAHDLKAFRTHAKKRAMVRKNQGSPHKDIFHHLMDEDGVASQPPSVIEVISDGGLAIIAGSDTTSTAIINLFYFLMCHPTSYKRLQAEIDELSDNDIMDFAKLAHLPYLNGCLNESLRLLPPVLSGSQRAPERGSGGKMIGPYFIPEGSAVVIPSYSLQRDPRCFSPLPGGFLPERWLPEDKRSALEPKVFDGQEFVLNLTAFAPFSLGVANCAGKNLAWMEMRMVVSLMVQNFEMKFAKGYNPQQWYNDLTDYFVTMKGELPTILTPRKPSNQSVNLAV
ncbi:unnamed protein product [Cyclocybe aegerita]|uniref:High nitrogen upregulated cytochrome P450 monooxygenase 2 n=1 Tax=Cyclocybe aegerita TaxID=1973307 RepID=A0A8S0X4N6_CYCAE|nr:unnamed protein product [Cyclocybe aegerita]